MKRVFFVFILVTIIELVAYWVHMEHPLVRPHYWNTLLLVGQFGMIYGGIEASRWLMRKSPLARLKAPVNDWTKLWLWVGPVGGVLLTIACIKGYFVDQIATGRLPALLIVAHVAGGALLWAIAAPFAIKDLYADSEAGFRERVLCHTGIATHVVGFCVYFLVFPAQTIPPATILIAAFFFYFVLYYVMLSIIWLWIMLRFWQPALPEAPGAIPTRYLDGEEIHDEEIDGDEVDED